MANEIDKVAGILPEVRNFYNGENGVQVAHADSLNQTINIIIPGNNSSQATALSEDYYNLLIGYDPFGSNHISVDRGRALTEYMAKEVSARFYGWDDEKLDKIKKLHAIICAEYNKDVPLDEQQGVIALIKRIQFKQNEIVVFFQAIMPIPMSSIKANLFELGFEHEWELTRTHWSIKNVNLMEVLADAGFNINNTTAK